jgi:cell division protein FtsB
LHTQNDDLLADTTDLNERISDLKDEVDMLKETEKMLRGQIETQNDDSAKDEKDNEMKGNHILLTNIYIFQVIINSILIVCV